MPRVRQFNSFIREIHIYVVKPITNVESMIYLEHSVRRCAVGWTSLLKNVLYIKVRYMIGGEHDPFGKKVITAELHSTSIEAQADSWTKRIIVWKPISYTRARGRLVQQWDEEFQKTPPEGGT